MVVALFDDNDDGDEWFSVDAIGVVWIILSMPVTLLLKAFAAWNNNGVEDAAATIPTVQNLIQYINMK